MPDTLNVLAGQAFLQSMPDDAELPSRPTCVLSPTSTTLNALVSHLKLAGKEAQLHILLLASSSSSHLGFCQVALRQLELLLQGCLVLQAVVQLLGLCLPNILCCLHLLPA